MKYIKYFLFFLLFIVLVGFVAIKVMSESKPEGKSGPEAEQLANKMLTTLNKAAFDTIPYLEWEFFREGQKYFWDKNANQAIIEYGDTKVFMDLNTMRAKCYQSNILLVGDNHEKAKSKAWSNWCNDSFWLIAPFKIYDKGTIRKVVKTDGGENLLIEYNSGGVTPGDSYLWILDENARPSGWKMWTSIIPIKGIYSSWHNWEVYEYAMLASGHSFFGKEVSLKNIKAGKELSDFGFSKDPFEGEL